MGIKKEGKLHVEIVERLKAEGLSSGCVEVATISRGSDHLIIQDGETIGEYNHVSKRLLIYKNT